MLSYSVFAHTPVYQMLDSPFFFFFCITIMENFSMGRDLEFGQYDKKKNQFVSPPTHSMLIVWYIFWVPP